MSRGATLELTREDNIDMLHWIADLVGSLGYVGVALLMAIENVVLPLPSEVIMPLAGFEASRGRMSFWLVILVGSVGSVVGALPVYALARMNVALFAVANFAGTIFWCTGLAAGGYLLGAHYRKIHEYVGPVGWGLLGLAVIACVVWMVRRRRRRAHGRRQEQHG